jgi:O-succinylbenzoate synthase
MIDAQKEKLYEEFLSKIKKANKDRLFQEIKRMSVIEEEKYKDFSFAILLIFWTESMLKGILSNLLLEALRPDKKYPDLINLIFDETTFISKIKITEFVINVKPDYKENFKDFFSFCRSLNDTRNQIFHAKLENITYRNSNISDINTQKKTIEDLINARIKMNI